MSARLQLQGQTFGRLYVIDMAYIKDGRTYWNCQCECGNQTIVKGKYLTNGETKSCGCLNQETRSRNGRNNRKYNLYEILDDKHAKVFFSNAPDKYFLCDTADLEKILQHCWWANSGGYARTRLSNKTTVLLHDFLLDFNPQDDINQMVDHKDHNPTNNTRENLRIVTRSENCLNRKNRYDEKDKRFRGVYKYGNKWEARIQVQKKTISVGIYNTFEEAKQARLQAEQEYYPGVIIS